MPVGTINTFVQRLGSWRGMFQKGNVYGSRLDATTWGSLDDGRPGYEEPTYRHHYDRIPIGGIQPVRRLRFGLQSAFSRLIAHRSQTISQRALDGPGSPGTLTLVSRRR